MAVLPDGRIAVHNSNHPDAGTLLLDRDEIRAWLDGIKAGESDSLATHALSSVASGPLRS